MNINRPYTFDRVVRIVLTVLIFTAVILLIKRLGSVLIPFIIAVFVAYLLNPLVNQTEKRLKTSRGLSVVIVVTLFLSVIAALLWWLIPTFLHEMNRMAGLVKTYLQTSHFSDESQSIEVMIKEFIIENDLVQYLSSDSIMAIIPKILPRFWAFLTTSINLVISIVGLLIIVLYVIFLLIDFERLSKSWSQVIPSKYRPIIEQVASDLKESMRIYIRSQGLIALIVGSLTAIGFSIIGLPMAIIMGLIIAILNLVPYLQLLALPPLFLLALLKSLDYGTPYWKEALLVFIVLAVVQAIQELVLNPRILGKAYMMNPAIILLSLSIWGSLMGIIGMMLALPLTTLIYSYYKNYIIADDNNRTLFDGKE